MTLPETVFPLLGDISTLDGVGEKLAQKLAPLIGGRRICDLLFHKPLRWTDRRPVEALSELIPDETQTVCASVQNFSGAARGSKLQKVRLADETGFLTLVFFNANTGYLQKQFPVGRRVAVSGLVEDFHGQRQMTHPEYVLPAEEIGSIPPIEPVYPLTAGITNKRLHGFILQALACLPDLPEWISESLLKSRGWPGFEASLRLIHQPETMDPDALSLAGERLAYDEALARALTFRLQRNAVRKGKTIELVAPDDFQDRFEHALPYAPTHAQVRAMGEIAADLADPKPMQRMLQGDVGSGKTTVAAFACALAVKAGAQVAIMAPTEVLARQLFSSIRDIVSPLGCSIACLTGGTKAAERRSIMDSIESGALDILCGTHALFQDRIVFDRLGFVVIDEQHRFGVNDRARLAQKGVSPHLLIMSATPIPRSLAMTIHGDVDLSILDEKPVGRLPVETRTIPDGRLEDVINAVGRAIRGGEQVFWVCPRVEDDEDGSAAISRHAMLDELYEEPVGLVHGKLSSAAKDAALEAFRRGDTSVLVATTVIEVGVDVPGATIIVIESAERFGLAQLHQLRGRVGRGSKKSFCLLVYTPPLGETAKKRLDTLRQSNDGFYIAEVDFNLRGPGDILGLAQSGVPSFRFLDLSKHQGLLATSQKDATLQLPEGATLSSEQIALLSLLGPEGGQPKV